MREYLNAQLGRNPQLARKDQFHYAIIGAGWIVPGIVGHLRQTGEYIPFELAGEPKHIASNTTTKKAKKRILLRHIAPMPVELQEMILKQAMPGPLFDTLKANKKTTGLGNLAILNNAGSKYADKFWKGVLQHYDPTMSNPFQPTADWEGLNWEGLATLILGTGCFGCDKSPRVERIIWEFGVRYCEKCAKQYTMNVSYHIQSTAD
jgi:hypothetical protein